MRGPKHPLRSAVLLLRRFEAVGLDPDSYASRRQILAAHFFGGADRIDRNRPFEFAARFDRPPERARGDQALAIGRDFFEAQAGDAAQFKHHAFEHDAEALADQTRVRVAQFERRRDADTAQPIRQATGDSPQVGEFEAAEGVTLRLFAEQKVDPAGGGILLRQPIGDLGERFRRRDVIRRQSGSPIRFNLALCYCTESAKA
jgi:hypothetical protein